MGRNLGGIKVRCTAHNGSLRVDISGGPRYMVMVTPQLSGSWVHFLPTILPVASILVMVFQPSCFIFLSLSLFS